MSRYETFGQIKIIAGVTNVSDFSVHKKLILDIYTFQINICGILSRPCERQNSQEA